MQPTSASEGIGHNIARNQDVIKEIDEKSNPLEDRKMLIQNLERLTRDCCSVQLAPLIVIPPKGSRRTDAFVATLRNFEKKSRQRKEAPNSLLISP